MTAIDRVIATARAEIGYIEKESNSQLDNPTANPGDGNWNKYARDLDALDIVYNGDKNGYAWCDIFVDWCFIYTFGLELGMALLCQAKEGLGAGCTYSARCYEEKGQFHTSPQAGDQIFFTNDGGKTMYHTGLVVKVSGGRVYTIEGNTSSAAGVVPNGGCVRDKSYPLGASYIGGYGRPDYSLVPDSGEPETPGGTTGGTYTVVAGDSLSAIGSRLGVAWQDVAQANGIIAPYTIYPGQILVIPVEEDDDDMSYEKFKEYMTKYRKELQDNDSGDWSKENRQWAVDKGLMAGNGTTVDGEPNMMWEDFLTREQNVTVDKRLYDLIMAEVKKLLDDQDKAIRADISDIVAEAVAKALEQAKQQ